MPELEPAAASEVQVVIVYRTKPRRYTESQKQCMARYRQTENGRQKCREASLRSYHRRKAQKKAEAAAAEEI